MSSTPNDMLFPLASLKAHTGTRTRDVRNGGIAFTAGIFLFLMCSTGFPPGHHSRGEGLFWGPAVAGLHERICFCNHGDLQAASTHSGFLGAFWYSLLFLENRWLDDSGRPKIYGLHPSVKVTWLTLCQKALIGSRKMIAVSLSIFIARYLTQCFYLHHPVKYKRFYLHATSENGGSEKLGQLT